MLLPIEIIIYRFIMEMESEKRMMKRIYLLHGLMGTSKTHFSPQMEAFKENFDIIAVDFPGHGENVLDASRPFFESALQWTIEKVKSQGPGHMIGLSMGASFAIHMAISHPELLESVVLTGYAPSIPSEMEGIMKQQYDSFMAIKENNPEAANQFKDLHGERWFETLKSVLESFTFDYPVVSDSMIKNIQVPTLILNGAKEKYEREAACYLANLNERITAGIIPNAGHTANLDNPEVYNSIVLKYWDSLKK